jgi:hypothetical protein
MNDVRRKEIRRALALIGEAKGILEVASTQEQDEFDNMPEDAQDGEDGQRAEDAVDALERQVVIPFLPEAEVSLHCGTDGKP